MVIPINNTRKNIAKAKAIEAENRKRLLKLNPDLNDHGGIYFLTREEDGFKYAYIGQSKESSGILTRLCKHLVGYSQHIDLSLRKHKLYSEKNPTGWKVGCKNFPDGKLDEMEQYYIKLYASKGYQLKISLLEKCGYTERMAFDLCRKYDLLSPIYDFAPRGGLLVLP